MTFPTTASTCVESPCRTIDYDTTSLGSISFRVRVKYSAINNYQASSTYSDQSWIALTVSSFLNVAYIIPPANLLGIGGTNYLMLLDADATGTEDSIYNNVFRFDPFTCDTLLGCPDPTTPAPSFYRSSSS